MPLLRISQEFRDQMCEDSFLFSMWEDLFDEYEYLGSIPPRALLYEHANTQTYLVTPKDKSFEPGEYFIDVIITRININLTGDYKAELKRL